MCSYTLRQREERVWLSDFLVVWTHFCVLLFLSQLVFWYQDRTPNITQNWGKNALHQGSKGNRLFRLLKGSRGDLLPTYKFLPREEITGTKNPFNLPEKAVTRANG